MQSSVLRQRSAPPRKDPPDIRHRKSLGLVALLARLKRSTRQGAILAETSAIDRLSRSLVRHAMDIAKKTKDQRKGTAHVIAMEIASRAASERSRATSHAMAERTEGVAAQIDLSICAVEQTTLSLGEMAATVTSGAGLMREFVKRMADVDRMLGDIRSIAQQTNLLALNAAIEAAHAEQHGAGFSVIAQEVRLLANRTRKSTTDIGELIESMTASAQVAATAMQTGRAAAETSIQKNLEVQSSFDRIRTAMAEIGQMAASVAQASEEQILAGNHVAAAVAEVDEIAVQACLVADAAAEGSITIVARGNRLQTVAKGWSQSKAKAMNQQLRATDPILEQLDAQQQNVDNALATLKHSLRKAGPAHLEGTLDLGGRSVPLLRFAGVPVTGDVANTVESVLNATGCFATIFVVDGRDFVRVATSVKLPNGQRATGTVLNPQGIAHVQLRNGKRYRGAAYVLGIPLVTSYEPLFSRQGVVIGAIYAGRSIALPGSL